MNDINIGSTFTKAYVAGLAGAYLSSYYNKNQTSPIIQGQPPTITNYNPGPLQTRKMKYIKYNKNVKTAPKQYNLNREEVKAIVKRMNNNVMAHHSIVPAISTNLLEGQYNVWNLLTGIATGTGEGQRSSNDIWLSSVTVRGSITTPPDNSDSMAVRMLIVKSTEPLGLAFDGVGNVFDSTEWPSDKRFPLIGLSSSAASSSAQTDTDSAQIIYDTTFAVTKQISGTFASRVFSKTVNLKNVKAKFSSSTDTSYMENWNYYLLLNCTNTSANATVDDTVTGNIRGTYKVVFKQ